MRSDRAHSSQSLRNRDSLLWSEDQESLKKLDGVGDILPEHYFFFRSRLCATFPEVALMCAVLEDAFDCFHKHRRRRAARLSQEAEEWFFDDAADSIFSFLSICAVLGLDANDIRRRLKGRYEFERTPTFEETPVVGPQHRRVA